MSTRHYLEDLAEIAAEEHRAGRMRRRDFLKVCILAGATPALLGSSFGSVMAAGKPKRIVLGDWGGDGSACHKKHYCEPFTAQTGIPVKIDGTGPLQGKIKGMVEVGKTIWDVCDCDAFDAFGLGKKRLLEPIDYKIVDKNKVRSGYAWEYGVCSMFYGYVISYDREKIDHEPNWADFWNVKKYPGKRSLYKWANGALEGALLADGVPPDKLYPLDVGRALKKIEEIKDHVIFWGSGAESQQLFLQREVIMGSLWASRADIVERDTKGRVPFSWNEAILMPGSWVVPKNNPAGRDWAMRFIASMQDPKQQVGLFNCFGQAPANPSVNQEMLPAEAWGRFPFNPDNYKKLVPNDPQWWGDNLDEALNKYLEMISA